MQSEFRPLHERVSQLPADVQDFLRPYWLVPPPLPKKCKFGHRFCWHMWEPRRVRCQMCGELSMRFAEDGKTSNFRVRKFGVGNPVEMEFVCLKCVARVGRYGPTIWELHKELSKECNL